MMTMTRVRPAMLAVWIFVAWSLQSCASSEEAVQFEGPAINYRPMSEVAEDLRLRLESSPDQDQTFQTLSGDLVYVMADRDYFLFRGLKVPFQGEPASWYEGRLWASEDLEGALSAALFAKKPEPAAMASKPVKTAPIAVSPGPSAKAAFTSQLIVIDPGHGGRDPGAISRRGTQEKDIALSIAQDLKLLLEGRGARVQMTREGDEFPSLQERPAFANAANATLFLSVHANSAKNQQASGVEVFWRPGGASAKGAEALAKAITEGIVRKTGARQRGAKTSNLAVLRDARMTAVLIEVGFLSNREEEQRLLDPGYRRMVAEGIAEGLEVYLQGGDALARYAAP